MAGSTRERLIKCAEDLFYRDGFHAVGLDRILGEVGVTKTTFYNHFESKDELILEVLRWHDRWWRDIFRTKLEERAGSSPRDQLLAVFDVVGELINDEAFNGCIFVNVSVEFPLPHDPAHQSAAEHKKAMEEILRDVALRAGARDPIALAEQIALLMEGAYVTRHVSRNGRSADIAGSIARLLIEQQVPLEEPEPSSP